MITRLRDGARRARLHALGAEDAPAQVQGNRPALGASDRFSRADRNAFATTIDALHRIHAKRTTVAVGQRRRRTIRVRHGLDAARQSVEQEVGNEHESP
jgi:hypothetical protein